MTQEKDRSSLWLGRKWAKIAYLLPPGQQITLNDFVFRGNASIVPRGSQYFGDKVAGTIEVRGLKYCPKRGEVRFNES